MKYRLLTTALIAMALVCATGCGSNEAENITTETTTENITEAVTEDTTAIESTEITTAAVTTEVTTESTENTTTTVTEKVETTQQSAASASVPAQGSLGVTYRNNKIMLNSNISEVSAALGSTTDYSEAPSCNYDGLDKVFVYGNVSIYTYPHASGDLINEIEVNDEQIATDKGIVPIGKTIDEVKAVYGEPTSTEGSMYKYADGNCYTYFYADNGVVYYWGVVYEA